MRGVVAMLLSQERAACVIISRCAAPMVKLVDTGDLKSPAARRAGSIPARSTSRILDGHHKTP